MFLAPAFIKFPINKLLTLITAVVLLHIIFVFRNIFMCKLENEILKEANNSQKCHFGSKNVILQHFQPLSKFYVSACRTLIIMIDDVGDSLTASLTMLLEHCALFKIKALVLQRQVRFHFCFRAILSTTSRSGFNIIF